MIKTLFWWIATIASILAIVFCVFALCGITKQGLVQTNWLWLGPLIGFIIVGWFAACRADEASFSMAYTA